MSSCSVNSVLILHFIFLLKFNLMKRKQMKNFEPFLRCLHQENPCKPLRVQRSEMPLRELVSFSGTFLPQSCDVDRERANRREIMFHLLTQLSLVTDPVSCFYTNSRNTASKQRDPKTKSHCFQLLGEFQPCNEYTDAA